MVRTTASLTACASALALTVALAAGNANAAGKATVLDKNFDVAGGLLAYTEFELSGEPLDEGLGGDLDALDPDKPNQPTAFDYTAGIRSYEYSEEAMYAVDYQSQNGPHLVNGPLNASRGGTLESLAARFTALAATVGFGVDQIPLNLSPITFPYAHALPEYAAKVDDSVVSSDSADLTDVAGKTTKVKVIRPGYARDFATLKWDPAKTDHAFEPAAVGGSLLKEVVWSQDFLGGFHQTADDKEVKADSVAEGHDGKHLLGKASKDGINGVILTEEAWDKLLTLRNSFGYNGKTLGTPFTTNYDATKSPVWFPNRVSIAQDTKNGLPAMGKLTVADGGSSLRNTWMLLWPLSEAYGYTDQRDANKSQNPAFLADFGGFDGSPFPGAPAANKGQTVTTVADDPFSVVALLSDVEFKNLLALHFDKKAGTLVDHWAPGHKGTSVTTFDAAYTLVALQIFERAQDALPVGYASGTTGQSLNTPQGKQALDLIKTEADFLLSHVVDKNGLVADSYKIGGGASKTHSLDSQFALIRGLAAAFKATGDDKYRTAARNLYLAAEAHLYDPAIGTWASTPGKPTIHTPWTAAAVSGALHELLLTLVNKEGEKDAALSKEALTARYVSWFETVVENHGMQQAEWLDDTGEHVVDGDTSGDVNKNGVLQITKAGGPFGTAAVLAGKVEVSAAK